MRKFLTVMMGVALATSMAFAQGSSDGAAKSTTTQPVLFRVSMPESQTDNKAIAIQKVVKDIEERTEGRVQFEVYYNAELGTFTDTIESITMGSNIIDGTSADAYAPYGCPDMTATNLMCLYPDTDSVARFSKSDLWKTMTAELEKKSGIKILTMNWCGAPREVLSNKPISSVADLKGKMIRVPLPPYVAFFKRLGCSTVNMTMAEVYTGLQQGMIDACEFPLGTIYTNSLHEVGKYVFLSSHTYAPTCWGMSATLFNKLSAEDQQVFMDAFAAGGDYFTKLNLDNMAEYQKKLETAGVTFAEPSKQDKAVMAAAAADAAKDFPELTPGIVDQIRATFAK